MLTKVETVITFTLICVGVTCNAQGSQDWSDLVYGKGIFEGELNYVEPSLESGSNETLLDELKQALDQPRVVQTLYGNYKKIFKKTYSVTDDRLEIFKNNLKDIAEHNVAARNGAHLWEKGVNQFTDQTTEELRKMYSNDFAAFANTLDTFDESDKILFPHWDKALLPGYIDHRDTGLLTPIKNQGDCNSCVMFATTAQLEYLYATHHNKTEAVSLSPQELIDCAVPGWHCKLPGSNPFHSYDYLKKKGVATEETYPYTSPPHNETCHSYGILRAAQLREYRAWKELDEETIQYFVANTVVMTVISSEFTYEKGIMGPNQGCFENPADHAVVIVGYGTTGGVDYWIIRNSWGPKFGENGYLRIQRNADRVCDIGAFVALAVAI